MSRAITVDELKACCGATDDGAQRYYTARDDYDLTAWTGPVEVDGKPVNGWWWALHTGREVVAVGWSAGVHRDNRDHDISVKLRQLAAAAAAAGRELTS